MRPISERRFQRLLLTLPIVVPILLMPFNWYVTYHPEWRSLSMPLGILGWSLILGGVPYALLVLGVLRWARKRPTMALWRLALFMPLMMIAVFFALFLPISFHWSEWRFRTGALDGWWIYPAFILVIGYFYVGLGLLMKVLVESWGWWDEERSAP